MEVPRNCLTLDKMASLDDILKLNTLLGQVESTDRIGGIKTLASDEEVALRNVEMENFEEFVLDPETGEARLVKFQVPPVSIRHEIAKRLREKQLLEEKAGAGVTESNSQIKFHNVDEDHHGEKITAALGARRRTGLRLRHA
jgi:hypothetical protein